MSSLKEILEWSAKADRPLWQRDALRRLLTSNTFEDSDEAALLAILKEEALGGSSPTATALEEAHLPVEATSGGPVQIGSVGHLSNANRLAPGQTLEFATEGITAVYGDNGAGKSGYVRVLKRVCRTKEAEPLLHNVFAGAKSAVPASATVTFRTAPTTATQTIVWRDGEAADATLSQISVFDSRIAALTLDADNELHLLPPGLEAVEKLAALCERLGARLKQDRNAVQEKISRQRHGFGEAPQVTEIVNGVTASTTDAEIEAAVSWTAADEQRLAEVRAILADPVGASRALRGRKQRLDEALRYVKAAAALLTDEAIETASKVFDALVSARAAARMASTEAFSAEPLPGVGTPPWRILFDAAREYSTGAAYPGRPFPATSEGDRCVLCHQQLDEDARDRLRRFKAYVTQEVEAAVKTAEKNVGDATREVADARANLTAGRQALRAIGDEDAEQHAQLSVVCKALEDRADTIDATLSGKAARPPSPPPSFDFLEVENHAAALDAEAGRCDEALAPDRKAALTDELGRLEARQELHPKASALKELRKLLEEDRSFEKATALVRPNAITALRSRLDERYVQDALKISLDEERRKLGLDHVPVRLGFSTRKGRAKHNVALDGADAVKEVRKVLSEGEYRAVALACFLAQVAHQSPDAGIVVDDPVSSLDHERRELVARRLVEEGKRRQVIVFTHDMVFYHMLQDEAVAQDVLLRPCCLERQAGSFGHVRAAAPWQAQKLKERLAALRDEDLQALKALHTEDPEGYKTAVVPFLVKLRGCWERLIEECVLGGMVMRFSPAVKTQTLDSVDVTDEIADAVHRAMTECSRYSHDAAAAIGSACPAPSRLEQLLEDLRTCMTRAKQASTEVAARRKERRKPRAGSLMQ